MPRALLLLAVGIVAAFNASKMSPVYDPVASLMSLNFRNYPLMTPQRLYDAAAVPIALMTLMLAGIPAAVYERVRGLQTSSAVSLGIWLAAAVLLALPTLRRVIEAG